MCEGRGGSVRGASALIVLKTEAPQALSNLKKLGAEGAQASDTPKTKTHSDESVKLYNGFAGYK